MRRIVVGVFAASVVLASQAFAADMAIKAPPPPPAAPAPSWTGFYIGANGGGAWGKYCWNAPAAAPPNDLGCDSHVRGPLAGGQAGYNWQTGNIVLGAEISADWADLTSNYAPASFPAGSFNPHVTSVFTATGRVGWAFDHFLAYGKGGAAWANETYFNTCNGIVGGFVCTPAGAIAAHASETRAGFTVGGGLEYLLTRNLSLAVEYSFLDFGNHNTTFAFAPGYGFGCGAGVSCPLGIKETVSTVTGRLNWHFGG